MADRRLYIFAPTFRWFASWCHDHGLAPTDPLLVAVLPDTWEQRIRGTSDIRYIVLGFDTPVGLMGELSVREAQGRATEMAEVECKEWVRQVIARRAHRCDAACICPADRLPMLYSPTLGLHACQDPDCGWARPESPAPQRTPKETT